MGQVPYHRNNLGTAIAQRARDRLEEQSTEQLSLRQIAQDLGVSSAAIYRHFPDKAALLANVSQTCPANKVLIKIIAKVAIDSFPSIKKARQNSLLPP